MLRPIAAYVSRLDATYRDRPYFAGEKARLLAGFNALVLIFVPLNVLKVLWFPTTQLPSRVVFNLVLVGTAIFSLRSLLQGRIERASNGLAAVVVIVAHSAVLLYSEYPEPLSAAIQIFVLDLVFLLFAIVFATRRMAMG